MLSPAAVNKLLPKHMTNSETRAEPYKRDGIKPGREGVPGRGNKSACPRHPFQIPCLKQIYFWGWGDGSVYKMLGTQAWGSMFNPLEPVLKPSQRHTYL